MTKSGLAVASRKASGRKVKQLPRVDRSRAAKFFVETLEITEVHRTARGELNDRVVLMKLRTFKPADLAKHLKQAAKSFPVFAGVNIHQVKRAHGRKANPRSKGGK
jgi:hypothetical protein